MAPHLPSHAAFREANPEDAHARAGPAAAEMVGVCTRACVCTRVYVCKSICVCVCVCRGGGGIINVCIVFSLWLWVSGWMKGCSCVCTCLCMVCLFS